MGRTLHIDLDDVLVEDIELLHGLGVFHVLGQPLRNFVGLDVAFVVDEGTAPGIHIRLTHHLHDGLGMGVYHVLEDRLVNQRAEIGRIGHEEVLLAFRQQLNEHAALVPRVVDITVTWRTLLALVVTRVLVLLPNMRITALVVRCLPGLLVCILLDDAQRAFVRVEGHR